MLKKFRFFTFLVVLGFIFSNAAQVSASSTLYGVDGSGQNSGAPNLYTINTSTGAILTTVGPVGYYITGLAFDPLNDGVLYGVSGNGAGTHPSSLFTINTTTGAGTWLGTIKNGANATLVMPDISFRSDGRLYGWSRADNFLYTIDLTSCDGIDVLCLATKVGVGLGHASNGNGMAFDSSDNLYLFSNSDDTYFSINPDTGAPIIETAFSNPSGNSYSLNAAAFNENDTLFATRLNYGDMPADLITINLGTSTITSTGANNAAMEYMDAIAFYIPPAPSVVAPTVTTSSASSVERNTATINGEITDTGGEDNTERGFNYGLTTSYGTDVSETGTFSTGTFSQNLSSLKCDTTYHFRAFAINTQGTSTGSDASFTTSKCPSAEGGSARPTNNAVIVATPPPAPTTTECSTGDLYSTTTGKPCTTFITNPSSVNPPGDTPACTLTLTLKQGSKGIEVRCLQTILKISSDGIFGSKTKSSVVIFQNSKGLVPDGIVGPKTRALLF